MTLGSMVALSATLADGPEEPLRERMPSIIVSNRTKKPAVSRKTP